MLFWFVCVRFELVHLKICNHLVHAYVCMRASVCIVIVYIGQVVAKIKSEEKNRLILTD